MTISTSALLTQRLHNQRLTRSTLRDPAAIVAWLGAVQAQDYTGAKWAIAQRVKDATDASVTDAFNDGTFLRTHVMRPTWHFVAPADIRWLQALTGPRVQALMATYDRQLELDAAVYKKSRAVLERALRNGTYLTRTELAVVLARGGIVASGQRLAHLMMRAELEAVVCSGPIRGKHQTYALLDERVPPAAPRTRDEALAELIVRYFTSHGPAQPRDFAWWSGLTMRDATSGIEMAGAALTRVEIDGVAHWCASPPTRARAVAQPFAFLLPNYDEYGIAYKDRSAFFADGIVPPATKGATEYEHLLMIDGQWAGRWKRAITPKSATVAIRAGRRLTKDEQQVVRAEAERYGAFLGLPVTFSFVA